MVTLYFYIFFMQIYDSSQQCFFTIITIYFYKFLCKFVIIHNRQVYLHEYNLLQINMQRGYSKSDHLYFQKEDKNIVLEYVQLNSSYY